MLIEPDPACLVASRFQINRQRRLEIMLRQSYHVMAFGAGVVPCMEASNCTDA